MIVAGQVFQVAADPVRFPQGGRGLEHPREFAEGAQQRALLVVVKQFEVVCIRDQGEFGGVASQR
ncbi:Uncharacterised protein [Mycobacterium tuberculosis]|nr:Uncharacterised protein [Mycobacterium tuberculosis]